MAGTNTYNGRSATLKVGSSTSSQTAFGHIKSWEITVTRDMIDVSSFDSSGWVERYNGNASWGLTAETLVISTAGTQEHDTLRSGLSSGTRQYFIIANSTGTSLEYSGWGFVSGWTQSGDESSPQVHNFTVTGDGALTEV